jgi:hypothetical protein
MAFSGKRPHHVERNAMARLVRVKWDFAAETRTFQVVAALSLSLH